jgi:hypothetical protein
MSLDRFPISRHTVNSCSKTFNSINDEWPDTIMELDTYRWTQWFIQHGCNTCTNQIKFLKNKFKFFFGGSSNIYISSSSNTFVSITNGHFWHLCYFKKSVPFHKCCSTDHDVEEEPTFSDRLSYLEYTKETYPSTDTEHWQGFAYDKTDMKFTGWKRYQCHILIKGRTINRVWQTSVSRREDGHPRT